MNLKLCYSAQGCRLQPVQKRRRPGSTPVQGCVGAPCCAMLPHRKAASAGLQKTIAVGCCSCTVGRQPLQLTHWWHSHTGQKRPQRSWQQGEGQGQTQIQSQSLVNAITIGCFGLGWGFFFACLSGWLGVCFFLFVFVFLFVINT